MDPDFCPANPEEAAETYLFRHMEPKERAMYEDHFMTCRTCAELLEAMEDLRAALRAAAAAPQLHVERAVG